MKRKRNLGFLNDLYFITEPKNKRLNVVEQVSIALNAGVKIVQYRDKKASDNKLIENGKRIRELINEFAEEKETVLFVVNDRIDIALAVNADGIHLGQKEIPSEEQLKKIKGMLLGISVSTVDEAVRAKKMGANYLGVGPIFETLSKEEAGKPIGVSALREIKKKVNVPVVAIGGINLKNVEEVLKAGADSVAVISAIHDAKNFKNAIKKFREKIKAFNK